MNDEPRYVNPWRMRSWDQGRFTFGGLFPRSEPMRPDLRPFQDHNLAVDAAALGDRRSWLESERFLLPEPMPLEHDYAPQLGFFSFWPGPPEERLERLHRASVGILGAGTLGSHVAHMLAAAGVGHLVLCDFDTVEVRNFNRQLYDTADLDRPKVLAAAERLHRLRPDIEIDCLQRQIGTPADVVDAAGGVDIVVRAIDTPILAPFIVDEGCRRLHVPHIGGGFLETWASAGPFIAPDGPCFRCLNPLPQFDLPDPRKVPTFAPPAFWLSSLVSGDVLRYLGGMGDPWLRERLLMVNWATGELRDERLTVQPGRCPVCGADNDERRRQPAAAPAVGNRRDTNAGTVSRPTPTGPVASSDDQGGDAAGSGGAARAAGAPESVVGTAARRRGGRLADRALAAGTSTLPPAVAPSLIGLCAVLASLLLVREPILLRVPCVLGAAVVAGGLGDCSDTPAVSRRGSALGCGVGLRRRAGQRAGRRAHHSWVGGSPIRHRGHGADCGPHRRAARDGRGGSWRAHRGPGVASAAAAGGAGGGAGAACRDGCITARSARPLMPVRRGIGPHLAGGPGRCGDPSRHLTTRSYRQEVPGRNRLVVTSSARSFLGARNR